MTNTRNTPVEVLEQAYPLQVTSYRLRHAGGGRGRRRGGDGLVRGLRFLAPARITLVGERREVAPQGTAGGEDGARGRNILCSASVRRSLAGRSTMDVFAGDVLWVRTPGGGGWGRAGSSAGRAVKDEQQDRDPTDHVEQK
jgi:N-methylhydantoinase B